jgi:hypothetical protein
MTRALILGPSETSDAAQWSRRLGQFAVPLAVIGTLAHRAGLAAGLSGVAVLALVLVVASLAVLLGAFALARIWSEGYGGAKAALTGVVLGLAVLAVPALALPGATYLPALTQVSTDLEDPPRFVLAAADRTRDALPADPLPAETRAGQATAYPAIAPLRVDLPAPDAHALVMEVVTARGWRVLSNVPAEIERPAQPGRPATVLRGVRQPAVPAVPARAQAVGRVEAVARTRVFGFLDDIVIRVRPIGPTSTRIDMRSASRVGWHDLGTNAARVEAFLIDVRDRAAER